VNPRDHKANNLINSLTNDEDQRQDLWVHYLSGHSPDSFASHLKKISVESSIEREFQAQLWHAFKNPPSEKFTRLLSKLSDVEQSIVCLLALGLTLSELSGYKGISQIRIKQVISVIKENDCWEELYAEEKVNRRRTPRAE
jgi:hypothetical protein